MLSRVNIDKAIVLLVTILIVLIGIIVLRFFTEDNLNKYTKVKEPDVQVSRVNEIKAVEIVEENKEEIISEIPENISKEDIVEDVSSRAIKETRSVEVAQESNCEEPKKAAETSQEIIQAGIPVTYKGYNVSGKIEIPKTGANLYLFSSQTVGGMEIAPCILCSTGTLNISGNTIITGHNYRNGRLFSNNNNIVIGDKIYITTIDNVRKEYTVYDKFLKTPEDASFYIRDTSNGPEITLSSCSDDDTQRVIILAR